MLIKLRFRFPDIFLGILVAVAIFLIGMAFSGSHRPTNDNGPSNDQTGAKNKNVAAEERLADYTLALDGLTLVLVVATIGLGIVSAIGIRNQSKETRNPSAGLHGYETARPPQNKRWERPCPCRIRQRWQLAR